MSMTHRFLKMWLIIIGYCLASAMVVALPFMLSRDDTPTSIVVMSVLALAGMGIVTLGFGVLMYRNWAPSVLRQARTNGVMASATVTDVTPTGWRVRRSTPGAWRVQQGGVSRASAYRKHEYALRVQIKRPDSPPYDATIFQVLAKDRVPKPGDDITVRVHPERADVAVMLEADPSSSSDMS
jgi:hypothetical protein